MKLPLGPLECDAKPDPRRFEGQICLKTGTQIGYWEAYLCEFPEDLGEHLNLDVHGLAGTIPLPGPRWPIAYLKIICVGEAIRDRGYGSDGLQRFQLEAERKGAVLAFARIGWCPDSPREKNIYFYQRAGWSLHSEVGEDGRPKDVTFGYLELRKSHP
ncbi:hypothetical protein [Haloferula sp. A504]|uniref:hypothetical protein n=1 Tax=Haloferula sp. A504 TaxID=3373601 RepID=UPI0031C3734C|nr:hypothetical protein [Verrucomicrobiaceae bacterium E54]